MGIIINLSGLNVSGDAGVMNNAQISNNDVNIILSNMDVSGQAKILENIEIGEVLAELEKRAQLMDKNSSEYCDIQRMLSIKHWNKNSFIGFVRNHLGEFSQGVLASVVANLIMK